MFLRWVEDNLTRNAYRPGPLEDAPVDPAYQFDQQQQVAVAAA